MAEILDQFGRPLKRTAEAELLQREAIATVGSVRSIETGHPADGITPPRLARILREAETGDATAYLELAEQMEEKDLHYAAVLGVRKRAIRSLEIQVDPGDDSAAAQELAEMTRKALHAAPVKAALIDMMDALGKGYSVSELLWAREGRNLVIEGVELVDPRWFEFDRTNGNYLYLRSNDGPQPLRADCFIIHMAKAKSGLPIRGGLARLAAWAYLFKNFTIKDWSIFLEAYGHPLRLGKYGPTSSPEDRRTLLRAARQIGVDMAAIIPKEMDLEVISAAINGAEKLYEGNARYWDEQTSKGVLGQVATTDAIAGGYSVGKTHDEVRSDIRDADAEQLAASLQRDVGGSLRRLNFGARPVALPIVSFPPPETVDPKLMMELMERGPKAGLKISLSQVREVFALREPKDGEAILTPPAPEPPPAAPPQVPGQQPPPEPPTDRQTAARIDASDPGSSIDAVVDALLADGSLWLAGDGEIGPLVEALSAAQDLDQIRDILDAYADVHPGAVVDLLTRATFAARLAGEVGAPTK